MSNLLNQHPVQHDLCRVRPIQLRDLPLRSTYRLAQRQGYVCVTKYGVMREVCFGIIRLVVMSSALGATERRLPKSFQLGAGAWTFPDGYIKLRPPALLRYKNQKILAEVPLGFRK